MFEKAKKEIDKVSKNIDKNVKSIQKNTKKTVKEVSSGINFIKNSTDRTVKEISKGMNSVKKTTNKTTKNIKKTVDNVKKFEIKNPIKEHQKKVEEKKRQEELARIAKAEKEAKEKKIMIGGLIAMFGFLGIMALFEQDDSKIVMLQKEINYELGSNQEIDYLSYINMKAIKEDEQEQLLYNTVDPDKLGDYEVEYKINDSTGKLLIHVIDTIEPKINGDNQIFIKQFDDIKFEEYYKIEDASKVEVTYDDSKVDYDTPGSYEVNIIAVDEAGNKAEKKVDLEIKELAPPMKLPSENNIQSTPETHSVTPSNPINSTPLPTPDPTPQQSGNSSWSSSSTGSNPATQPAATGEYCFVTKTGKCYHRINNCGRTNPNNTSKITISEAKASGYTQCSDCWH